MKRLVYELWYYDVWGNEKDGFTVNDRYCANREFVIWSNPKTYNRGTAQQFTDFSPTNQQILDALIDAGKFKDIITLADVEIEGDDQYIYITNAKTGRSECELVLVS